MDVSEEEKLRREQLQKEAQKRFEEKKAAADAKWKADAAKSKEAEMPSGRPMRRRTRRP